MNDIPDQPDWPAASRRDDPTTSHESERTITESGARKSHLDAILTRLRQGPATNVEVGSIGGLNYKARISDIRKMLPSGWVIRCELRRGKGKPNLYHLERWTHQRARLF